MGDGEDGEDDYGDGDPDDDGYGDSGGGGGSGPGGPGAPSGSPGPLPALINLIVPAGTLLGWSAAPGQAGTWGLTDPADTRAIIQAASRHPRTRWCLTLTGPDGTALAHGCARGQHPWTPAPASSAPNPQRSRGGSRDGPATSGPGRQTGGGKRDGPGIARDGPPDPGPVKQQTPSGPQPGQSAQLNELLRRLNVTLNPIARGVCDHRHQEHRYTPSRMLQHLIRARTTRCTAPGCGAQAYFCDLDHAVPYPAGRTCQCGLGPVCRRHHRCKQAPGWKLCQPRPGIMRWTTPSGRTYTTTPTVYDLC